MDTYPSIISEKVKQIRWSRKVQQTLAEFLAKEAFELSGVAFFFFFFVSYKSRKNIKPSFSVKLNIKIPHVKE